MVRKAVGILVIIRSVGVGHADSHERIRNLQRGKAFALAILVRLLDDIQSLHEVRETCGTILITDFRVLLILVGTGVSQNLVCVAVLAELVLEIRGSTLRGFLFGLVGGGLLRVGVRLRRLIRLLLGTGVTRLVGDGLVSGLLGGLGVSFGLRGVRLRGLRLVQPVDHALRDVQLLLEGFQRALRRVRILLGLIGLRLSLLAGGLLRSEIRLRGRRIIVGLLLVRLRLLERILRGLLLDRVGRILRGLLRLRKIGGSGVSLLLGGILRGLRTVGLRLVRLSLSLLGGLLGLRGLLGGLGGRLRRSVGLLLGFRLCRLRRGVSLLGLRGLRFGLLLCLLRGGHARGGLLELLLGGLLLGLRVVHGLLGGLLGLRGLIVFGLGLLVLGVGLIRLLLRGGGVGGLRVDVLLGGLFRCRLVCHGGLRGDDCRSGDAGRDDRFDVHFWFLSLAGVFWSPLVCG